MNERTSKRASKVINFQKQVNKNHMHKEPFFYYMHSSNDIQIYYHYMTSSSQFFSVTYILFKLWSKLEPQTSIPYNR